MRNLRSSVLVLAFAFSILAQTAGAGIRVVSDIDDTIRASSVGGPLTGMREMYQSFAIDRKYKFDYVTGTPAILRPLVSNFLSDAGFPEGGLHTRGLVAVEDLKKFKLRVIRELMDANPDDSFVFVGDDTANDYDVYDELFRSAPERVPAIYIRRITNHNLPPSAFPFLTAFDIARTEFVMGRLEVIQAAPVALAILGEKKDKRIIPNYAYCPVNVSAFADPQMDGWDTAIRARVQVICLKRKPTTEITRDADLD